MKYTAENIVFKNGIVLDGTMDMKPVKDDVIFVKDGRIEDIRKSSKISSDEWKEIEKEYRVIDLNGQYLMPGLINLHVHLALSGGAPKPSKKEKKTNYTLLYNVLSKVKPIVKIVVAGYAKTHLMSGTTTIRTVGGMMDLDAQVRDDIKAGKRIGPRILCANNAISVPGGHFAGSLGTESNSVEEVVRDVREIAKTNPDLIKLMITGGVMDCEKVGEPGILKMKPEFVKAACDEAHKMGYKVAAHVESPEGIEVALENGVDSIEHGAMPNDKIINLFKKKKAALVGTIAPAFPYAIFDRNDSNCLEVAQINSKVLMKGMITCIKKCLENGISVGMGTDASCPFVTHYTMPREVGFFHKYVGVSEREALYIATLGNAKIIGIDRETGSIEKGKCADMIVLAENPLKNLKTLQNVKSVMTKGIYIENPTYKRDEVVDRMWEKYENAPLKA